MAKTQDTAAVEQTQPAQTGEVSLSLEEFCKRLSTTEQRVELIGGFFSDEKIAGHLNDTESSFAKRYQDFINRPA